jgi:hypothetical protein
MDYIKLALNDEMYDKIGENYRQFSFTTSGYVEIIAFGEIQIWCSEDSSRKWLTKTKDYEPFKPFIKRVKEEMKLQSFKF